MGRRNKRLKCQECQLRDPIMWTHPSRGIRLVCMVCVRRICFDPLHERESIIREFRDLGKGG